MLKNIALLILLILFIPISQAQITVLDDLDQPVRLELPATRIVTLSPHTAELAVAAGLSHALVGVADFSEYPKQLNHLLTINSINGVDRERLLLLKPDLVVAWASGNKPADIQWLKHSGIPVYLSEPRTLDQISTTIEKLGKLAGSPLAASIAARKFNENLAQSCLSRQGAPLLRVFYEIWPTPPMTIGGDHWLNEVLALAGLENIFKDQPRQVFSVDPESLLSRQADIRVSLYHDSTNQTGRLVTGNHLLSRPGPRLVEGLRQLCSNL